MIYLKIFFVSSILLGSKYCYSQQFNSVGSGNCLEFNGVDNYVDLGDIYDDLYPPFTISAWINLDASVASWAPIFVSQDNSSTYKGTVFLVSKDQIGIEYGDGRGWNNPQFRRSKGANIGNITNKWIHVAGIIRSATDMDLYVNGIDVGGSYSGTSPNPMVNKPGDVAKIGSWYSNSQHFRFKGMMDELRIWNYSRTEDEIRSDMCRKLIGNESGLIGYWKFDETSGSEILDYSDNGFNGALKNGTNRVTSGASLGDTSLYEYSHNFADESMSIGINDIKQLFLDNISANSQGAHLYRVDSYPSDKAGIPDVHISNRYYGIFISNYTSEQIEYDLKLNNSCASEVYFRVNNSDAPWTTIESDVPDDFVLYNNDSRSKELLFTEEEQFSLGSDTILCQGETLVLNLENFNFNKIEWSNGSSSPIQEIKDSGIVWVKGYTECGVYVDTINVFGSEDFEVDLGEDVMLCNGEEVQLSVRGAKSGHVLWQDGSSEATFIANTAGIYWAKVETHCGVFVDSVSVENKHYSKIFLPNVVTPNGDNLNDNFQIDEQIEAAELKVYNRWGKQVFSSENYNNDWPNQSMKSGIYYYRLLDNCSKKVYKGFIHVLI